MSHIVTLTTEVRDPLAVAAACRWLGLPEPLQGNAKLFDGEASGLLLRLPGWLYSVVLDTASGQVRYDNFGGAWGEQEHLNKFLQHYAVEKARLEAHKRGHSVTEQALDDGSVRLTVSVGGGA